MRRQSRQGFTLFEVLIALTVVVILVGVMATTINVAFRQKRAAEEAIEAVRDTQTVGDIWVQEMSCAAQPTPSTQPAATQGTGGITTDGSTLGLGAFGGLGTSGGLGTIDNTVMTGLYGPFLGDSQSVKFYATGPEPKADLQGDARYIEFVLGRSPSGETALVRHVETNLMSDAAFTNMPEELLIAKVRQVKFSYWDGTQWLDNWDSVQNGNTLPYAVSMELTLDPIREGGAERVIKRTARLWCAAPAVDMTIMLNVDGTPTDETVTP